MKNKIIYLTATLCSVWMFLVVGCNNRPDDFPTTIPDAGPDIVITNKVADPASVVPAADVVSIPNVTFKMGLDTTGMPVAQKPAVIYKNQSPVHSVTLSAYKIMAKQVTVAQYRKFVDANSGKVSMPDEPFWGWNGKEDYPIVNVTWKEAKAFADWMGGRLPTEAEWEYAARNPNGDNFTYSASNKATDAGWFYDNSTVTGLKPGTMQPNGWSAHQVATKKANALGMYDMAGNVIEWCADWFADDYYTTCGPSITNPAGPSSGTEKVARGGSWFSPMYACSSYARGYMYQGKRSEEIGFRIVMP